MRARLLAVAGIFAVLPVLQTARAQDTRVISAVAGLTLAKVAVDGDDEFAESPEQLVSYTFGLSLNIPRTPTFAIQPELLLVRKGYSYSNSFVEGTFVAELEGHVALTYVQVPVLAQFVFPSSGEWQPMLFVGPALALRLGCSYKDRTTFFFGGSGETTSSSGKCSDQEDANDVSSVDVSAVLGGGVKYRNMSFQLRYDHGLSNVISEPGFPNVRNRALTFAATIAIGEMR